MTKKPFAATQDEIFKYIDRSKPVKVYRNLTRKCYSVQQGGIVRCHVGRIELWQCKLKVSESGRQRVLKERRKNVHAFVEGRVSAEFWGGWSKRLYYNPYEGPSFRASSPIGYMPVDRAAYVALSENGACMAETSIKPR